MNFRTFYHLWLRSAPIHHRIHARHESATSISTISAQMAHDFSYQKISKQEVRLLTPRRSTKANELRFAIRPYSPDKRPDYVAISYTWGKDTAQKVVYLNDTRYLIRPNLWWCLYYVSMNAEWRHVWVDFICIDQSNIEERNEQVQTMDGIFSNASLVIAWLGVEDEVPDWKAYKPMDHLQWNSEDMEGKVKELAHRPFWSRRWVIQELLLAVRVQILCAGHCISWSMFKESLIPDETGDSNETNSFAAALPFLLNRDEHAVHYPSHSLHDLLLEYRHTVCLDPRDRVFALLGLLSVEERQQLSQFFPDYALDHHGVGERTMEHLGFFLDRKGRKYLPLTEQCKEMLEALGFKNKLRAANIFCSPKRI